MSGFSLVNCVQMPTADRVWKEAGSGSRGSSGVFGQVIWGSGCVEQELAKWAVVSKVDISKKNTVHEGPEQDFLRVGSKTFVSSVYRQTMSTGHTALMREGSSISGQILSHGIHTKNLEFSSQLFVYLLFFRKDLAIFTFMCIVRICLEACLCNMCIPGAHGSQQVCLIIWH